MEIIGSDVEVTRAELGEECVADCSGPGRADEAVAYWRKRLGFQVPRDLAVEIVACSGGWDREELKDKSDDELSEICLWFAACDLRESGEECAYLSAY